MAYAFVRNLRTNSGANLKHFTQIQAAERHAKRLDLTSAARQRIDGDHRTNYFWSKAGEGLDNGGADYTDAYKAHKTEFEVKSERKNAAIGVHFLVGVSPDWLAETDNPRGLDNSRVTSLIAQAKDWAESWMGDGAVWGEVEDLDRQARAAREETVVQEQRLEHIRMAVQMSDDLENGIEAEQRETAAKIADAFLNASPKPIVSQMSLKTAVLLSIDSAKNLVGEFATDLEPSVTQNITNADPRVRLQALLENVELTIKLSTRLSRTTDYDLAHAAARDEIIKIELDKVRGEPHPAIAAFRALPRAEREQFTRTFPQSEPDPDFSP